MTGRQLTHQNGVLVSAKLCPQALQCFAQFVASLPISTDSPEGILVRVLVGDNMNLIVTL
jgi:hypothetical protein